MVSVRQDTPRTPQELQLVSVAGYTAGPDISGALGRNGLFVRASLLGPRGWDNSERSSAQGAGLAHWLQVGAVQVEPVGSLAGRLLEGSPGHMAPGEWDLQDDGTDGSTEPVGKGEEAASVRTLGASEVQTDDTPWT